MILLLANKSHMALAFTIHMARVLISFMRNFLLILPMPYIRK
jgi:hypothetical protein